MREARADADRAEVASVSGQYPVDLTTLSNGGHGSIDQTQIEVLEFGVEFKSASDVGREGRLIVVTRRRVENLGDQLAHRRPVLPKEIVDLGENEPGHDDEARRFQNLFVLWEA